MRILVALKSISFLFLFSITSFGLAQSVLLTPSGTQAVNQPVVSGHQSSLTTNSLNNVSYVDPNSTVDVVTQINTLSANCGQTCTIHIPSGSYTTTSTSPILLGAQQSLVGDGISLTAISGNVTTLLNWHGTNANFYAPAGRISDISFHCGAATTRCLDIGDLVQAHILRVLVDDAPNGDCVGIQNNNHWFERSSFEDLTVGSDAPCHVGIHAYGPIVDVNPGTGGPTGSFGYASWRSIYQNNSTVGVRIDGSEDGVHDAVHLYDASELNIQSNQDGGTMLVVGGIIQSGFMSLTGEGAGSLAHVLTGGIVQTCLTSQNQLSGGITVDDPPSNSDVPFDGLYCGAATGIGVSDFAGTGPSVMQPISLGRVNSTGQVTSGIFEVGKNSTLSGGVGLLFSNGSKVAMGYKAPYDVIGTFHPIWSVDDQGNSSQFGSLGLGGCAPVAHSPGTVVTEAICDLNQPILSFQSGISNAGAKTWGFYAIRDYYGPADFHFGTESDSFGPLADAWNCTQSAGNPTGCSFIPQVSFSGGIANAGGYTQTGSGANIFTGSASFAQGITAAGGAWAVDSSGAVNQSGSLTVGTSSTTNPGISLVGNNAVYWSSNVVSGAVDQKVTNVYADTSGLYHIQFVNDAGTYGVDALTFSRSGANPSGATINALLAVPALTSSGAITSQQIIGPTSAPSGTCATAGAWVFSQDGHATFCSSGGSWVTKI